MVAMQARRGATIAAATALRGAVWQPDDKTGGDRIVRTMGDTLDDVAWREQCRYQLERDVMTRIKYGFCHVHKPVLDDTPVRTFATMAEYRRWCDLALPAYLGYRLASRDQ